MAEIPLIKIRDDKEDESRRLPEAIFIVILRIKCRKMYLTLFANTVRRRLQKDSIKPISRPRLI